MVEREREWHVYKSRKGVILATAPAINRRCSEQKSSCRKMTNACVGAEITDLHERTALPRQLSGNLAASAVVVSKMKCCYFNCVLIQCPATCLVSESDWSVLFQNQTGRPIYIHVYPTRFLLCVPLFSGFLD